MKEIKLTQGQVALVDDEDFALLNQWKWYAQKDRYTYYAVRQTKDKPRQKILMHRQILWLIHSGFMVDHIDHNGLNNQRGNIRTATGTQNQGNRVSKKNSTSIYKGVCRDRYKTKWQAHIQMNGKLMYLGLFEKEQDAAKAYNSKAVELYGSFAKLNKCGT